MAERWTVVAARGDRSLVEIRHSDGVVYINPNMDETDKNHAITELAKRVLVLQQTLAAR